MSLTPTSKNYFIYGTELKFVGENTVEGYITTGDVDLVNDIVTPDCMMDMLSQMKGRTIKVDIEHESFRGKSNTEKELNKTIIPIGKITDSALESKGIKVRTELNMHSKRYEEVKGSIKDGFLDAFSIAYVPIQTRKEVKDGKEIRRLEKVNLLNVAYTGNPVNTEAGFTDVILKSITELGGNFMEKTEQEIKSEAEAKAKIEVEAKANAEKKAKEEAELKETQKAEVKSVVEGFKVLTKGFEELKDSLKGHYSKEEMEEMEKKKKKKEGKTEGKSEEIKALTEQMEKMQEEIKGFNEILKTPEFKSRVENMKKEMEKNTETKSKATGPLDYVQ